LETFAKQVSEVEPEISKTSSKKADSAKYRMRMAQKKSGVTVLQNIMCDIIQYMTGFHVFACFASRIIKVVHPAELIARFLTTCYCEHDLLPSSLGSTLSHARSFRFAIPAVDPKATANSLQCCALGRATWAVPFVGQPETEELKQLRLDLPMIFSVLVSINSFFT